MFALSKQYKIFLKIRVSNYQNFSIGNFQTSWRSCFFLLPALSLELVCQLEHFWFILDSSYEKIFFEYRIIKDTLFIICGQ